ncbi:MAG: response regulator transcription factor [Betaproteobacteria bacterium]
MQTQPPSAPSPSLAARARPARGQRLLVVEDDASVAAGLAGALSLEGHVVEHRASGEAALARIAGAPFDLLVLDIGLPGIDGFEVLRRLRLQGHTTPVLVLTARDAVGDRIHGLDLGADDYMTKPFSIQELAARVRALLRRRLAAQGQRLVHGPLELDVIARRAFLSDAPLELAAREWAVLEVLLSRVEKLVSKESIGDALTGGREDLSANAIEVYISRLRAKLDPAGIRIRTVRGFGYMLEEFRERGPDPV